MSVCRVSMLCYIFGDVPRGEYPHRLYSDNDLHDTIDYCKDLIAQGYRKEPHDQFSLRGFIRWARQELKPDTRHPLDRIDDLND